MRDGQSKDYAELLGKFASTIFIAALFAMFAYGYLPRLVASQ